MSISNWFPPAPLEPPSLLSETLVSFGQAAALFPPFRLGRPVSPSCVWRWHRHGVRLPDGRVVRLEAVRVAGRFLTTIEAVHRFIAAQQPDAAPSPTGAVSEVPAHTPTSRTPARRARDSENALRRLQGRRKVNNSAGR
jgi:Protein of unknown function (DUF1580)